MPDANRRGVNQIVNYWNRVGAIENSHQSICTAYIQFSGELVIADL